MTVIIWGVEVNIVAQIFGFLMMLFLIASYQFKGVKLLLLMAVAYCFCFLEAFFLGVISNMICAFVSIVRNVILAWLFSKDKKSPVWLTAVLLMPIIAVLIYSIMFSPWYESMPPILVITFSVVASFKNEKLLKGACIGIESGYLIFDIFIGAYVGVIRQVISVISAIFGFIRYVKGAKNEEKL